MPTLIDYNIVQAVGIFREVSQGRNKTIPALHKGISLFFSVLMTQSQCIDRLVREMLAFREHMQDSVLGGLYTILI